MLRKVIFKAVILILLIVVIGTKCNRSAVATSSTIIVPWNYPTIQAAINAARPGDTIIVRPGMYRENVFLNKPLTLIGEDRNATVIDGDRSGNVIHLLSSNAVIMNFTVQNSGNNFDDSGILIIGVSNTTIRNNLIKNNSIGLLLRQGSNDTLLIDNLILNNTLSGIRFADNNNFNLVISNTLMNNTIGVEVHASSFNTFYHNNFIDNTVYQVLILGGISNKWDNGVEGNYWSDYGGSDANGDGIGDTELPFWVDYYPLMDPWSITRVFPVEVEEESYYVTMQCNSTVASFNFDHSLRQISFRITGPSGMSFYCNVSVPKPLLNATPSENWLVQLNKTDISAKSTIIQNTHTSIYFTYSLSTYEFRIRVVKVANFIPYIVGCGVAIAAISIMMFVMLKKKRKH